MRLRIVIRVRGRAAAAHTRYDNSLGIGIRGITLFYSLSLSPRVAFIGPAKFARIDMHVWGNTIRPSRTEMRKAFLRAGNENLGLTGLTLRNIPAQLILVRV